MNIVSSFVIVKGIIQKYMMLPVTIQPQRYAYTNRVCVITRKREREL